MGGLAVSTVFTILAVWLIFDIAPTLTLVAILLSTVLAAISTRSAGETDINPISGVGKVTQLVYAGLAPGQSVANVLTAGITGAGATQAGDMMQDLKTGYLLGAWPRKQFVAQLAGIAAGVVLCVPIFLLITHGQVLGEGDFPAPAAFAWKAMADVLSEGLRALPTYAQWGALFGLVFGVTVPLLRKFVPRTAPFLPSALAFGIAFIIPAFYSIPFLIGALVLQFWKLRRPLSAAGLAFAVASGVMVGSGLTYVVTSVLDLVGAKEALGL
jgi:OPT family oligopeptide transporter